MNHVRPFRRAAIMKRSKARRRPSSALFTMAGSFRYDEDRRRVAGKELTAGPAFHERPGYSPSIPSLSPAVFFP